MSSVLSVSSVLIALLISAAACRGGSAPAPGASQPATPTAKVENPKPESELSTIRLSPEAEKHLAIMTAEVTLEPIAETRTVGGEAIVPPGRSVVVTAPVAGTLSAPAGRATTVGPVGRGAVLFELLPLQSAERDVRAEPEREVKEVEARLVEATQRLQRLEQLLKEGSASARSVEEARANHAVISAAVDAARRKLDAVGRLALGSRGELSLTAPIAGIVTAVHAAPGQTVAAGAPIADVAQTATMWVRVPVYAGDLSRIDTTQPAAVAELGGELSGPWRDARRVSGPPMADASASSVDLFFELPGSGPTMRPGERLAVRLALRSPAVAQRAIVVPRSAIVYDLNGGTWVYEVRAPHVFARRRVELAGPAGAAVIVGRGLAPGTRIVILGAAELYGTEFFVNK